LSDNHVNAIIFFVVLDEYNILSSEEQGKTKMEVALECFKEVIACEPTNSLPMILFLNKKDLFETKLKKDFKTFQDTFPNFTGGKELKFAVEFIENQFQAALKDICKSQEELYVHTTCALDTEAMDTVFQAVSDTLFTNSMMMGN